MAVPPALAVTVPLLFTVATFGLVEDQVTLSLVTVPTGYTCFLIVNLFPLYKILDLRDNTSPVAGCVTFTTQEAVTPVNVSLAVIKTGSPVLCAVTSP